MIQIELVSVISEQDVTEINSLIVQLSSRPQFLDSVAIKKLIDSSVLNLFIATSDKKIVGMATLLCVDCLTGSKGIIEDVIVDSEFRRRGIAEELINVALEHAKNVPVKYVDLTSRPDRIEANRLYQKIGFVKRDTNIYRYPITPIASHTNA